jgi:hypothetical protein
MLLGWLQLRHKPLRLAVALSGIAFAVLLILMQLGFRSALFESAVRFHERLDYDIALFSPDSVFIVRPQTFSIRRLYQTLGFEAVEDVTPVYIFPSVWKNPWNNERRSINTIGFHPDQRPVRQRGVRARAGPAAAPGRGAVRPRLAPRIRAGGRHDRCGHAGGDGNQRPRSRGGGPVRDGHLVRHRRHGHHQRRQLAAAVPGPPAQRHPPRPDPAEAGARPRAACATRSPNTCPATCWC